MALSQRQRWMVLGGALAVTLALVVWMGGDEQETVEPAGKPAAQARPPGQPGKAAAPAAPAESAGAPGLRVSRGNQGGGPTEVRDLFAKQTWHVPPPAAPAGPPEPPPLPFTYIGKLVDNGKVTIYLEDDDERNLSVRQGDVIDGIYRVKRITAAAVTFIYIPMNKQQILEIGSAN